MQFSKVSDAEGDFAMQPRLHDPVAMAMQHHGGRLKGSEHPTIARPSPSQAPKTAVQQATAPISSRTRKISIGVPNA